MSHEASEEERRAAPASEPVSKAEAPQAAADDSVTQLQSELEAARAENEEQMRAWQRTQADFVNYRRRVEQERAEFMQGAEGVLILDLLPVVDDLDRALASVPPELRGLTWVDGILLIERKLRGVLGLHGVTPIDALGHDFDPREHEAVLRDGEPGDATVVTAELQKGYRLNDRVLRPTLVKVGAPANKPSTQ